MKKILGFFLTGILCFICFSMPVSAVGNDYKDYDFTYKYVVDDAKLITNDRSLSERLEDIGEKYDMDIVIVTVESLGGKTATAFADDFYDYNDYADDGILFLISMEYRDWAISTKGKAISAFTDSKQSEMISAMRSNLSNDNFSGAFNIFANKCESILNEKYGTGKLLKVALIGVVTGLIVALITVLVMQRQLKSVVYQRNANTYVRNGSVRVTQNYDIFLYRNVTKTRRESSSGSSGGGGGGSSTHTSSSGSTHGGSSGKF